MLVNLAEAVSEILDGKESVHSVRLLDLEQRREELKRRNQAALHSVLGLSPGVDEIHWTMEALDRSAAHLFRIACEFHELWSDPDQAHRQMMALVRQATESLLRGYVQMANCSLTAEFDADEVIGSMDSLDLCRDLGLRAIMDADDHHSSPDLDQFAAKAEQMSDKRASCLDDLYNNLSDILHELARAGLILKQWSQRMSAGVQDSKQGWLRNAPCDIPPSITR